MIITRTPYRISFFGGGTDLPEWFKDYGGSVLSTTINKYCYVTCRYLPPFFQHRHRVVYSKTETVNSVGDIRHPVVRECLKYLGIQEGVEIHHDGDLPARAGLGTSSSFTVGLLHALHTLKGDAVRKWQLAREAVILERDLIGDTCGCQDQTAATFGGFNRIDFTRDTTVTVTPIILPKEKLRQFKRNLMLFFTGFTRVASDIEDEKVRNYSHRERELSKMQAMVGEAIRVLDLGDFDAFGSLLHENWLLKRTLSTRVSTPEIDEIYEQARLAGALGGKLLGAGGGGFMAFYVPPDKQGAVRNRLSRLLEIPFDFDNSGSQVIFSNSSD